MKKKPRTWKHYINKRDSQTREEWGPTSEFIFLAKIGSHGKMRKLDRRKCLEGYIEAAQHRTDWGDLDKEAVIKFARECLG